MSQEERLSHGFASPLSARGLDVSLNRMSQMVRFWVARPLLGMLLNWLRESGHAVCLRRGAFIVFDHFFSRRLAWGWPFAMSQKPAVSLLRLTLMRVAAWIFR